MEKGEVLKVTDLGKMSEDHGETKWFSGFRLWQAKLNLCIRKVEERVNLKWKMVVLFLQWPVL